MKILNLYAGIGGNRKLWGNEHEITAVENSRDIAVVYSDLFPNDTVIVADAHKYLLDNYKDFDFIWSSPPCQSHSQIRYNIGYKANRKYKKVDAKYPDLKLYEEVLLLKYWFNGKWVVENTIPYYKPLIEGVKMGKHLWWSNFDIGNYNVKSRGHRGGTVESLTELKGIDISKYDIKNKRQILRNCVEPELGLHIINQLNEN
jgi:DNA (cytosine-5)-methyltransferase 1|tara:strand:+ start:277 stop:882 length:606 start_codon:yes stop_codon:yes gene_type:complete